MPMFGWHIATIKKPEEFDNFITQWSSDGVEIVLGTKGENSESAERQAIRFKDDTFTVVQAKAWMKQRDISFVAFEKASKDVNMKLAYLENATHKEGLYDIPLVGKFVKTFSIVKDIMSTGTWNNIPFNTADLDNMVENFDKLKRGDPDFKDGVPLKIDLFKNVRPEEDFHGGEPTFGLITELTRAGEKVFAKITNIPRLVKDMIENKQYRQVSAEVGFNKVFGNERLSRVLKGVALLGVELPGVSNLDEFQQFYSRSAAGDEDTKKFITEEIKKQGQEEEEMELKELQAKMEELQANFKKQGEEIVSLKKENEGLKTEKKTSEENLAKFTSGKELEEIKTFAKSEIKEGRLLPANEASTVQVLSSLSNEATVDFAKADGKGTEKLSPRQIRMNEITGGLKVVEFKEQLEKSKENKGSNLEEEVANFKKQDTDEFGPEKEQKADHIVKERIATFKKENVGKEVPSYEAILNQVYVDYPELG